MNNYIIMSDSSCDLPADVLKKYNIDLIPYYVSFDTFNYYKENIEITIKEFYNNMGKQFPKTSLPSTQDYIDKLKPHLENGFDIICICLSSKFSGSYQSATTAKNILLEEFPLRKIKIIDSALATGGQGLLVYEAALLKENGADIESAVEKLNKLKQTGKIYFTVESLEHLHRGGRIGKASALAGTILNIKPIIVVEKGELLPSAKVRGKKKAIIQIVESTLKEINNFDDYHIGILRADRTDILDMLKKEFIERSGIKEFDFLFRIGITIGTHTGPSAVGIAFIKKFDKI